MDIKKQTGKTFYSNESTGPGLELMGNCRDSSETISVGIVQRGVRHIDKTKEPVLAWRFTAVIDAVLQSSGLWGAETSSEVVENLQNKVIELERAVTALATSWLGLYAPSSSNAPFRAKDVFHALAGSEAYPAFFKDPKSVKNFINKGLGPESGCDVVSPSQIASRGTNCTLNEV